MKRSIREDKIKILRKGATYTPFSPIKNSIKVGVTSKRVKERGKLTRMMVDK